MQTIDIDYKGVLDYLDSNQEIPYSDPETPGIDPYKKEGLLKVKEKGQAAVAEMKKMAGRCEELYGLDKCLPFSWLDGSNTKTRKYLWAQMKYKDFELSPISISLLVEKNDKTTRYRICLDIKNDGTDKATMAKYHSHLDMPLQDGMVYVSGSNEWGNPDVITDTQDVVKTKIKSGEIRKAQLCIYIEQKSGKTNEEYDSEIMSAVKKIIPYYEYVIGKGYWPSDKEYQVHLTKEDWKSFLEDVEYPSHKGCIRVLKCMLQIGGVASCKQLADKFGGHPTIYTSSVYNTSRRALKFFKEDPCPDGKAQRYFPIAFLGRYGDSESTGNYVYKMREELKEALQEMDLKDIETEYNKDDYENSAFDKNMILYGPPGTGKTYSTAIYAVAICDGDDIDKVKAMDYSKVMTRYRDLTSAGRVAFTTFHQSYGYEEFIEGIKPIVEGEKKDIGYTIEPGVFKSFCSTARKKKVKVKDDTPDVSNARVWCILLDGTGVSDLKNRCFEEGTIRIGWHESPEIITEETESLNDKVRRILLNFQDEMEVGDIVVTERSNKSIDGIGVITGEYEFENDDNELWPRKRNVKWLMTGKEIDLTELNDGKNLDRKTVYALYRIEADKILGLVDNPSEVVIEEKTNPFVFVIDEINRGNISKIFGELITLIEDTKREGMDEQASAILPYSGDPFSVPSNVYILGTMNTADRSIALMDTALRRRFQFVEMMPDCDVLRSIGADKVDDLDVAAMLEKINERITFLYDREHTIGHAFFTKLANSPDLETLQAIFEKSVIPLLQEYFYEDYQKIQLVLGDNGKTDPKIKFILDEEVKVKNIFRGNADDVIDLPEKKYFINKEAFSNIESYKQIV